MLFLLAFIAGCCCTVDQIQFPEPELYHSLNHDPFPNPSPFKDLGEGIRPGAITLVRSFGATRTYSEQVLISDVDGISERIRVRVRPSKMVEGWEYSLVATCELLDRACDYSSDYRDWLDSSGKGFFIHSGAVYATNFTAFKRISTVPHGGQFVSLSAVMHRGQDTPVVSEVIGKKLLIHWWNPDSLTWSNKAISTSDCLLASRSVIVPYGSRLHVLCGNSIHSSNPSKDDWDRRDLSALASNRRGEPAFALWDVAPAKDSESYLVQGIKFIDGEPSIVLVQLKDGLTTIHYQGPGPIIADVIPVSDDTFIVAGSGGVYLWQDFGLRQKNIFATSRCGHLIATPNSGQIFAFCDNARDFEKKIPSYRKGTTRIPNGNMTYSRIMMSPDGGDSWQDITKDVGPW